MQIISSGFQRNTSFCDDAFLAGGLSPADKIEEPLLYRWFKDGRLLPDQNRAMLAVYKTGFSDEGQYQCFRLDLTARSGALTSVASISVQLSGKKSANG
jgi:hypothetical protein